MVKLKEKNRTKTMNFFKANFTDYQSPSDMYKKLRETKGAVNKVRVDSIKKVLSKLKRITEYTPKDYVAKTEENEKIIDIVERILKFNNEIQSGQRLKILTPSQIP